MTDTSDHEIPPERWQAVWSIVDAALELDPSNRNTYIRERCAHDAALKHEVEQFLIACNSVDRSGQLLNEPVHDLIVPLSEDVANRMAAARAELHRNLAAALGARYRLGETLGSGGMATVYRAFDTEANADVAVKVLHPGQSASLGAERFLREVKITASLRHPNIIPVLDAGVVGELPYYIMPCVAGQTLKELLEREPQLPVQRALAITRDVVAALDEAHAHGIVHRDVKPQNILLDGERALVADFGIARALEAAGGDTLTESGVRLGTPSYMSPEQAAGERVIDARSDIYSLACVVYEMLVGEPPFTGTATSSVLAKHLHAPAPDARIVRPSLPEGVHDVLTRALAKRPVDRYGSAREFMTALESAIATPGGRVSRVRWLVGAGMALLVGGAALAPWSGRPAPPQGAMLDTTRLVLLPLEIEDSAAAKGVDDDLLYESLARWKGITAVDRLLVADAARQRGSIRSADDAFAVARSLGAGRVVRGRIVARAGARQAYLTLYDVISGAALHQASGGMPSELREARSAYARVADTLLLRGAPASSVLYGTSTSRFLPTVQAMTRARAALADWRLEAADSSLEMARSFDVDDPAANLWLAQVRAWRGLPVTSWSAIAARAASRADSLAPRERDLARALVALADGAYESSCGVYAGLVRQDTNDFAGWYGLGQCRRMDKVVVPDPASPSRWRFRSSYDSAIVAFTRAFAILPTSLHGYEPENFGRLRSLLMLSTSMVSGRSVDGTSVFYGRPDIVGGRVGLVPYPAALISDGGVPTPAGFENAMMVQRRRFRDIADNWSSSFPRSAAAKHAVALALELARDQRAIDTLRVARRIETSADKRARLATAEVLLRVKFGVPDQPTLLMEAAMLADSLLADTGPLTLTDAGTRATLATLRGQCAQAESYNRRSTFPSEAFKRLAPRVAERERGVLARASLGCEMAVGELATLEGDVARELRSLPAAERARFSEGLLFRPVLLASRWDSTAVERLADHSTNGLVLAVRAYVRHDERGARRSLTAFASVWREGSGPVTPDIALPEARLFALLGDTTSAIIWLDRALGEVSGYDPEVLTDHATLAALVRAMLLRSEIAAQRGDTSTARRWAKAVRALWGDADPELRRMSAGAMSVLGGP